MLQGILCNHIEAENPHGVVSSVNGQNGVVELKHADLQEVKGADPTSDDTTRNKHLSNADAKKWNSAVYSINDKEPDTDGNFTIEAGQNVEIVSSTNKIKISSTNAGGHYWEQNYELSAGASETILHKFGKYPNVDIYKVIKQNVFTKEDIAEMAVSENKTEATIKKEIGAEKIDIVGSRLSVPMRGNMKLNTAITNLNTSLIASGEKSLMLSSRANMYLEESVSRVSDDVVIAKKSRKIIRKVVGLWEEIQVEVVHMDKDKVKITNLDKGKLTIKAILTA